MASRRTFIATGAALAATASALTTASASPATAAHPAAYDFPAVAARLARPVKHRQVYATSRVADGVVTGYMKHAMDAYETAYGEGPGALHTAAVFDGRGVVLGLGSDTWNTYRLAQHVRRRGDSLTDQTVAGNPFLTAFTELSKRGATFLVCDNALADWATYLVTAAGYNERPIEAVHADLRAHLITGALLVPAGVAALNQVQEAHFTYVQASL